MNVKYEFNPINKVQWTNFVVKNTNPERKPFYYKNKMLVVEIYTLYKHFEAE